MKTRKTTQEVINEFKSIHGDKYDYSEVNYTGNKNKVIIRCNICGNKFEQRADHHKNGHGCPYCSGNKKHTTKSFIEKANIVHNNKYDYSKTIYKNNTYKVTITCPIHGEFQQQPNAHLSGQGCPQCGIIKNTNSRRLSQEEFINRANVVHNNKYDYSKTIYKTALEKVIITCPKHGDFIQTPAHHMDGNGCPRCSTEYHQELLRLTTDQFIEKAEIVHNGIYDYSLVDYKNAYNKLNIICSIHGSFFQNGHDHLRGHGCPKCNRSKLELEVSKVLSNNQIEFEIEKKFTWLGLQRLDFYLPKYKIAIECQGIQHYKPVDFAGKGKEWALNSFNTTLILDKRKKESCAENNIKLIYFTHIQDVEENKETIKDPDKLLNLILSEKEYESSHIQPIEE